MGPQFGGNVTALGDTEGQPGGGWLRAITLLGVPAAIACFLVWNLTSSVSASLTGLQTGQRTQDIQLAAISSIHSEMMAKQTQTDREIVELKRYLQLICYNTSKTDPDRRRCTIEDLTK